MRLIGFYRSSAAFRDAVPDIDMLQFYPPSDLALRDGPSALLGMRL